MASFRSAAHGRFAGNSHAHASFADRRPGRGPKGPERASPWGDRVWNPRGARKEARLDMRLELSPASPPRGAGPGGGGRVMRGGIRLMYISCIYYTCNAILVYVSCILSFFPEFPRFSLIFLASPFFSECFASNW